MQYILKHGKRYTRRGFVVCVLRSGDSGGCFAVLISKKVIKGAVLRNRLRRVFREVVRVFDCRSADLVVLYRGSFDSGVRAREHLHILLREIFDV